jgi:flagellar motor switch protein FliN/FliY
MSAKPDPTRERLARFIDLPVEISVELGRKSMGLNQLLKLGSGSVIPFASPIDESLTLLANGLAIGRCDLVPGEGNLHVRVTDLQP